MRMIESMLWKKYYDKLEKFRMLKEKIDAGEHDLIWQLEQMYDELEMELGKME